MRNMRNNAKLIVDKAWNYAHVLCDAGLSYMAYTEQITFLLFLKMADERTRSPYNQHPIFPRSTAGRACCQGMATSSRRITAMCSRSLEKSREC